MFGLTINHDLVRKYIAIFGSLFKEVRIVRSNDQTFDVPCEYGPRDKYLERLKVDPEADRQVAITMPRITYELINMNYNPENQISKINQITKLGATGNTYASTYQPVPYILNFQVNVISKTLDDGNQVIGQIVPFFAPNITLSANVLDDFDSPLDIPIVLNSLAPQDSYDSDYLTRRALTWTLDFTMKVMFYGPLRERRVIKIAKTSLYTSIDATEKYETVTIRPGLTANGEPTTDINETVGISQINEDDDFGYIITYEKADE